MNVMVEFNGLAEEIAGMRTAEIPLAVGDTYQDVVRHLADRFPDMVGPLINPADLTLLNATVFIRNGDELIPTDGMDAEPQHGDHLNLLTVIVGG